MNWPHINVNPEIVLKRLLHGAQPVKNNVSTTSPLLRHLIRLAYTFVRLCLVSTSLATDTAHSLTRLYSYTEFDEQI